MVNDVLVSLDIVNVSNLRSGSFTLLNVYRWIDLRSMGAVHGFEYGDLSSVAISTSMAIYPTWHQILGYIVLELWDSAFMLDGIAAVNIGGTEYVITVNVYRDSQL